MNATTCHFRSLAWRASLLQPGLGHVLYGSSEPLLHRLVHNLQPKRTVAAHDGSCSSSSRAKEVIDEVDALLESTAWMMDAPWPQLQRLRLDPVDVEEAAAAAAAAAAASAKAPGNKGTTSSRRQQLKEQPPLPSSPTAPSSAEPQIHPPSLPPPLPPPEIVLLRDDALPFVNPLLGGNKARKLDALIPWAEARGARHLVTVGGLQSAHTAAVAAAAAGRGLASHLLIRGEAPPPGDRPPTGYHLMTRMLGGSVRYVPRREYADREGALRSYVAELQDGGVPEEEIFVIEEGGAMPAALLGFLRLARHLSRRSSNSDSNSSSTTNATVEQQRPTAATPISAGGGGGGGRRRKPCPPETLRALPITGHNHTPVTFVVDSGTGATAVGLALACALLSAGGVLGGAEPNLATSKMGAAASPAAPRNRCDPWRVVGVMLAGGRGYYEQQQERLIEGFARQFLRPGGAAEEALLSTPHMMALLPLEWVDRTAPRRFGKVLPGEIARCRRIAQARGVLLDPIYSLAGWDATVLLAAEAAAAVARGGAAVTAGDGQGGGGVVVYVHSGGALGLFGLAQRHPAEF